MSAYVGSPSIFKAPFELQGPPVEYSAQPDHFPAKPDNHIDHLAISLKWPGLPGTIWIVHSLICEQQAGELNPGLPHRVRECIPLYYRSMQNVTVGHGWIISDNTNTITHEFMLN